MPRIEQNQLIATVGLDPERINFIQWFYSQFDYASIGINRRIINVEPLYFQGAIAGTEFLTYAATKLYIVLKLSGSTINTTFSYFQLFNEANALNGYMVENNVWYDTVGATQRYAVVTDPNYNFYFSRIVVATITHIIFNGFRITLG